MSSVCHFFPHALRSSEETVTILGLNHSLYMSSFLATKDWKPWMEWGLMAELNCGNLGLILLFALEFSLNTVKPVWLFTREHLLYVVHIVEVWLGTSVSGTQGVLLEALYMVFALSVNCICSLALKPCSAFWCTGDGQLLLWKINYMLI